MKIQNLTPRVQQALSLAYKEAVRFRHRYVGSEHLLLGLVNLDEGLASVIIQKKVMDLDNLRLAVEKHVGRGPGNDEIHPNLPYTPRLNKILTCSQREAKGLGHLYVGTEHLLLGILDVPDCVAMKVFKYLEADEWSIREEVHSELGLNNTIKKPEKQFPRFLMEVDGNKSFMPIGQAGRIYDTGHCPVKIVGLVLESDYSVREITTEERQKISDLADQYSESK